MDCLVNVTDLRQIRYTKNEDEERTTGRIDILYLPGGEQINTSQEGSLSGKKR